MRRRRAAVSLAAVLAVLGTMVVSTASGASADGLDVTGKFDAVFSPNGDFNTSPPATVAESTRYPAAVSDVALPSGGFVFWNGLENLETAKYPLLLAAADVSKNSRSRLLRNPGSGAAFLTPSPEDGGGGDMFCADQRILFDGTVMVTGGTIWRNDPVDVASTTHPQGLPGGTAELFGNNATRIYSPPRGNSSTTDGGTWTQVGTKTGAGSYSGYMKYGRWYPALVTLPDGKLLVSGGVERLIYNSSGLNVANTETFDPFNAAGKYDPKHGSWKDNGESGKSTFPLFPRLHVIHDGRVFYGANGQMWGPFGQAADEAMWNFMKFYDPSSKKWTDVGTPQGTDATVVDRLGVTGAVSGAAEIMLPFQPGNDGLYHTTEIIQAGGVQGTSPGTFVATNLARKISITSAGVQVAPIAQTNNRRWYSSGVIGATGEPMIFNGADKDEVICGGCESPVRQAEMYDAAANKWIPMASGSRDRTYHNSAILLSDGRVMIGGHAPINTFYGPGEGANDLHNNTGLTANNYKDPSFQIFEPPYLFRGVRPYVEPNTGPEDAVYGTTYSVDTPDAATVNDAILVHMPATTHTTDADMRAIVLPITSRGVDKVSVHIPTQRGVATPGWYYLFLRRTNAGYKKPTVSNAKVVRIGEALQLGLSPLRVNASASTTAVIGKLPVVHAAKAPVTPGALVAKSRPVSSHKGASRSGALGIVVTALVAAAGAGFRVRHLRMAQR